MVPLKKQAALAMRRTVGYIERGDVRLRAHAPDNIPIQEAHYELI